MTSSKVAVTAEVMMQDRSERTTNRNTVVVSFASETAVSNRKHAAIAKMKSSDWNTAAVWKFAGL